MKNGGGHFAPELGGHFELESDGHFKLELGGQYHWNLHLWKIKTFKCLIFTGNHILRVFFKNSIKCYKKYF